MNNFREELAWAAGFFDGEGHCGHRNFTRMQKGHKDKLYSRRQVSSTMTVSQMHVEPLERFQAAVLGRGHIRAYTNSLDKTAYRWTTGSLEVVQAVAVMMWPFLCSVKQDQIYRVLQAHVNYLDQRKRDRGF